MPDEKQRPKFEGERSMLPFFLAGLPAAAMAYRHRGKLSMGMKTAEAAAVDQSAAIHKVVGGRAASYFQELQRWQPDLTTIDEATHPLILDVFKRRLGPTGHAMHLQNLEHAMDMVKGKPGLTRMLRQSFEELSGLKAGAIGPSPEALLKGIPGAVTQIKPGTIQSIISEGTFTTRRDVLVELLEGLMRPELKMSGTEAVRVAGGLQDLAAVAERTFGHKPTFHLMMKGKDAAASEMLLTFPRTGGKALEFRLPLPTAEGIIMEATGGASFARRVLAEPATFARQGGTPLDISAPEAIINRLRNIITQPTDVPMGRRLSEMQQQVRKLLIWQGPEKAAAAGVLTPASAGRGFTGQTIVDPFFEETQATRLQSMERLGVEHRRAVSVPAGPLGKNVVLTEAAAAEVPSILTPQHYGQAMTKGLPYNLPAEWEGVQLFQVSPGGIQAAAEEFGYAAVPRTDQIMMAEDMREGLMGMSRRQIKIDPTLPANKRLQRIQQMLMDHKTTQDMLTGGSSVGEALQTYARVGPAGPGAENIQEMEKLLRLKQGEVLGFTQAGAVKTETYGMRTFLRDIRTVGEETILETEARYPMTKAFSPGGIKHTVEYGERGLVREIGIFAKTEELLRAQQVVRPEFIGPGKPLISMGLKERRRRELARIQATELWEGSQGIVVEGAAPGDLANAWENWVKIDAGKKNMARFNQIMMQELEAEGVGIPVKMAQLENLAMQRKQLEALARARGLDPAQMFHPTMLARRVEQLRMGQAPGVGGLGRVGKYTDDVFHLLEQYGMTSVAADIESRVVRDMPVQRLMETTFRAVRAGETALPGAIPFAEWSEMVYPKGEGMAGTIFDPLVRGEVQARGGILELPQTYTVGGARIRHLPVPELESGSAGFFTTKEGQVIQKEADRALREVMQTTAMDVSIATPGVEPAGTAALEEYFGIIDKIRLNNRNLIGGEVTGSRQMIVGKWLEEAETMMVGGEEVIVPRVRITRSEFSRMLKERVRKGLLKDLTAQQLTEAFKAGRLPGTFTKYPVLGPMSSIPVFYGPATHEGAEAGRAYLDYALHRALNIDLDQDPIHADIATTEAAFNETTAALESGGVGKKLKMHQDFLNQMERGYAAEGTATIKRVKELPLWVKGRVNPDVIRERLFREMSSKADIGIFHTQVANPIAQTARELGVGMEEAFITHIWKQAMEEGTGQKVKHAMDMPPQLARQVADAFRRGRHDRLMALTQDILGMQPGEAKLMMDEIIGSMATNYASMSLDKRQYMEAVYASKSKASARNIMIVADGAVGGAMSGSQAARGELGAVKRMSSTAVRYLGRATEFVKGHKKGVALTLAASAAIGLIASKPRDLTPDAVESGQLAGGPSGSGIHSPMPQLGKNVHYRLGTQPGFRVRANLNKIVDHEQLGNKASQMTGNKAVRINVTDGRRRITREHIELAMRDDRILGSRTSQAGFYNNFRG